MLDNSSSNLLLRKLKSLMFWLLPRSQKNLTLQIKLWKTMELEVI